MQGGIGRYLFGETGDAVIGKHLPAGGFGLQRVPIALNGKIGIRALLSDDLELFSGALQLTGKAEQFKKKSPLLLIGRFTPDLGADGLQRRGKITCIKRLLSSHGLPDWRAFLVRQPQGFDLGRDFVSYEVPASGNVATAAAIFTFLLRVRPLYLPEVETHSFLGEAIGPLGTAAGTDTGDNHLFHFDFHVFQLVATSPAQFNCDLFDVLAVAA